MGRVRGRPRLSKDVECFCIKCGTKFIVREWQIKGGRGKFCSRTCYESPGPHRDRPSLRVEPTPKNCELCGKEFFVGGATFRGKYKTRFCSMSCATKWKYRERILKGGSQKGRRVNHQEGYFERLNATEHPTTWDIAWAAGVYEGEGWCQLLKYKDGTPRTQAAAVGQKDRWLCDRLRNLFGGYVGDRGVIQWDNVLHGKNYRGEHGGYQWHIHGPRARGFLMTIYKFLSPRRQAKIKQVLST